MGFSIRGLQVARLLSVLAAAFLLLTGCLADPVSTSRGFAVEPRELYFINSLAETVGVYQPDSGLLRPNAFAVGSMPNHIVYYDGKLFVVNSGDNSLSVYDRISFVSITELYLGSGRNPYSIILSDQLGLGFVPNFADNSIAVIDLATLRVLEVFEHESLATPQAGAVYNEYLFVTNPNYTNSGFGGGSVSVFRISDAALEFAGIIETGPDSNPQTAVVLPEREELHIVLTGIQNEDDGEVLILDISNLPDIPDPANDAQRLVVGGSPSASLSGWNAATSSMYLSGTKGVLSYGLSGDQYVVLRDSDNPVLVPAGDLSFFSGVAVDAKRNQLLITDFQADSLVLLRGDGYKMLDDRKVSDGPLAPLLVEVE